MAILRCRTHVTLHCHMNKGRSKRGVLSILGILRNLHALCVRCARNLRKIILQQRLALPAARIDREFRIEAGSSQGVFHRSHCSYRCIIYGAPRILAGQAPMQRTFLLSDHHPR